MIYLKGTLKKRILKVKEMCFNPPLSQDIFFVYSVFFTTLSSLKVPLRVHSSIFEAKFVPGITEIIETVGSLLRVKEIYLKTTGSRYIS